MSSSHLNEHAKPQDPIETMQTIKKLLLSRAYWLVVALSGAALLAVALYYQHVLGDEPCQVCIQLRVWVAAFALLAVVMIWAPPQRWLQLSASILLFVCGAGVAERSFNLYQIENGRGEGSCEFFLGYPDWFALDKWIPEVFEVRNLCGYTPEMFYGLSMAESLLLTGIAICLVAGSTAILWASERQHWR
ncbi:MAG: disulfide bond formation protein B [Pseudomonadota bacterium]